MNSCFPSPSLSDPTPFPSPVVGRGWLAELRHDSWSEFIGFKESHASQGAVNEPKGIVSGVNKNPPRE